MTIIDAGMPGYYGDIPRELQRWAGRCRRPRAAADAWPQRPHRVRRAVAPRATRHRSRSTRRTLALPRGEVPNPPRAWSAQAWAAARVPLVRVLQGGLRTPTLREVATFGDGATLDVPGSPRVILTPGHTPGSAALHVSPVMRSSWATRSRPTRSPRAPWSAGRAVHGGCGPGGGLAGPPRRGLRGFVLPGHGDAWTGGIQEAVRQVRRGATTSS